MPRRSVAATDAAAPAATPSNRIFDQQDNTHADMLAAQQERLTPEQRARAKVHRTQAFEMKQVHRMDLLGATYNPRFLDVTSKRRLREGINDFGLMAPITVNSRNGVIVGGHQRLTALDELDSTGGNYMLDVAFVDLSPEEERAANVLLNNPNVQGNYDQAKLQAMFEDGVNPFAAKMEMIDLEMDYGHDFALAMQRRHKENEALSADEKARVDGQMATDPDALAKKEAEIALIKERKAAYQDQARDAARPDYNLIIAFASPEDLEAYIEGLGYDISLRALPADELLDRLDEEAENTTLESLFRNAELDLDTLIPVLSEREGLGLLAPENTYPILPYLMKLLTDSLPAEVLDKAHLAFKDAEAAAEAEEEDPDDGEEGEGGEES